MIENLSTFYLGELKAQQYIKPRNVDELLDDEQDGVHDIAVNDHDEDKDVGKAANPYQCTQCTMCFSQISLLVAHFNDVHKLTTVKIFELKKQTNIEATQGTINSYFFMFFSILCRFFYLKLFLEEK